MVTPTDWPSTEPIPAVCLLCRHAGWRKGENVPCNYWGESLPANSTCPKWRAQAPATPEHSAGIAPPDEVN